MDVRMVPDDTLNKLLSQTYHWKTLPPSLVYGMAVELSKSRFIIGRQYELIGDLLAAKEVENNLVCNDSGKRAA